MTISDKPQTINKHTWYYENEKSIDIIHELRDADDQYTKTISIRIPWHRLKKSLARLEG